MDSKKAMVDAIVKEVSIRSDYLDSPVKTLYFGGGTPSLLSIEELEHVFNGIEKIYALDQVRECTFEANPEDLTKEYLNGLKKLGVNRLSIGIQTFDDKILSFLNRAHSKQQALDSVENARAVGFKNISLDLIYSIPGRDAYSWETDLVQCIALKPEHISCYGLTIEEKTVFGNWHKKGRLKEMKEDDQVLQYNTMIALLRQNGYEQYEVSNFCLSDKTSQHNSNYWKGEHYLGLGPSAHSFNGNSRSFTVSNNPKYLKALEKNEIPNTKEILSNTDKGNEYILTRLRTKWGVEKKVIAQFFDPNEQKEIVKRFEFYRQEGYVYTKDNCYYLTDSGRLLADVITEALLIIE